jgi:hypothetical protein
LTSAISANTAKFYLDTKDVNSPCSGQELKDFNSLEVTYLRKMNNSLSQSDLTTAKLIGCKVIKEAVVTRERRVRRGKVYPAKIKKGQIELEVEYISDLRESCDHDLITHEFNFGGITVLSNPINRKILDDLGINFIRHTIPGIGYGQVDASVKVCL